MNRFARWGFALVILPVAACASNPPAPPAPVAPPAPPPLAAADASFVTLAAQGGMAEVQEAQLAQSMAHAPKVKSFAAKMFSDHTANNDQLKQIASAKGVTLPGDVSDAQTQEMTKLKAEKGRHFDRDYIADQIAGHQQMLAAFQAEAQNGTDADLKKFAADTVPMIQSHLDMATSLSGHAGHKGMHHHHHMASKQ